MLQFVEVHLVHSLRIAFVQSIALLLVFNYAWVGSAEFLFVEAITKALASFCYFLLNLLFVLSDLVFDKHVSAVTLL